MSLKLAWYGDDFTGSTDVLEAVSLAGLEAVLFLRQPDAALLARFRHCQAIGLAGDSRSQSPAWMDEHLPGVFSWMKSLGAGKAHYKVCSTFDSSPSTGSIGRAMELGQRAFGTSSTLVLAGAPALGRYVIFGHLFARSGDRVYRIDRHPVMSRHPVTPMRESDLALHLAEQTSAARFEILDGYDEASMREAGARIDAGPAFVVGSSGVEHALTLHWGLERRERRPGSAVDRLIVLSGSCSGVTARQIEHALQQGYAGVSLLTDADPANAAVAAWEAGRSVVLYSSKDESDRQPLDDAGRQALAARRGEVLDEVLKRTGARRVVIAGGDTSSHAVPRLGLRALEFIGSLAPGAPLCRAAADDPARDGLEIVCKGGQCGGDGFFEEVRRGGL